MRDALPNALVGVEDVQAQFEHVAPAVRSAKDFHVAACAFSLIAAQAYRQAKAVALVTRNTRDFRKAELAKFGIALDKPDAFLSALFDADAPGFSAAFRHFRTDLASKLEPADLLERLRADGQVRTADALHATSLAGDVAL